MNNNCYLIFIIIFLVIFYVYKPSLIEGMVPNYFIDYTFVDRSSVNREKIDVINKNYIKLIKKITNEVQGGEGLDDDELIKYMAVQIAKARRITENEIMKDPKLINPDGSWKKELIDQINLIIQDIQNEEDYNFEQSIRNLPENEKQTQRRNYDYKKENEKKLIAEQTQRWGKPLYLMSKKEMDSIFKEALTSKKAPSNTRQRRRRSRRRRG